MKKICFLSFICLVMFSSNIFAHHPAEDIVDTAIYEMIDAMVSQTPHDTIIEEMMSVSEKIDSVDPDIIVTKISTNSMGAAESLINRGLISFVSMLTGETSITIEYDTVRALAESDFQNISSSKNSEEGVWWSTSVIITIRQIDPE